MKLARFLLDKHENLFKKGTKLESLYPVHEALDTFFFTPKNVTKEGSHVRDALDLKRMMTMVIIALGPCILMAMYNTGLQANIAITKAGAAASNDGCRSAIMALFGFGFSPNSVLDCLFHGALYLIPVILVTYTVGGLWEALFAIVRKHDINEGFLVTGMLFPLICPPTIPLWQVAIAISFGVVVGKEVFGGTGMNILNPALTARAFLFFAYAAQISGDKVWISGVDLNVPIDGLSGATLLSVAATDGAAGLASASYTWMQAFLGTIPGSMGETSAAACLFGAFVLIVSRVGSWRTMAGIVTGTIATTLLLNFVGPSESNHALDVPFWWHMVIGGWAFGAVFMATDPVSSAFTSTGKLIYGFCIGMLVILIRVVNGAFPEGMMLAILLMNVFAATIDHFVVQKHINRRAARNATV